MHKPNIVMYIAEAKGETQPCWWSHKSSSFSTTRAVLNTYNGEINNKYKLKYEGWRLSRGNYFCPYIYMIPQNKIVRQLVWHF